MEPAHSYDIQMNKVMRRTVAYFENINNRAGLTREDKQKLKDIFLKYTTLPKAEHLPGDLQRRYTSPIPTLPRSVPIS